MFAPLGWVSRSLQKEMYSLFRDSSLFDSGWYKSQLRGFAKLQDPVWHYIYIGWLRGLSPSRLFDPDYYTTKYGDLRTARVNPLHHYLTYGRDEGRLPLRSSQEIIDHYLPEAAALRTFVTPAVGSKRMSVLLDSSAEVNCGISFREIILLCSKLAQAQNASLRILTRGNSLNPAEVEQATASFTNEFHHKLEITPIPSTHSYSDLPVFDEEITIATSWSSAQALRFVSKPKNSWCWAGQSALGDLASEVLALPKEVESPVTLQLSTNTGAVREHLRGKHLSWPESLPKMLSGAIHSPKNTGRKWKIGVYCQPHSYPGAFSRGIEALTSWLLASPLQAEHSEIFFFGESTVPLQLAAEFTPQIVPFNAESGESILLDAVVFLSNYTSELGHDLAEKGVDSMCVSPGNGGKVVQDGGALSISTSISPEDMGAGFELLHQRFLARQGQPS